MAAAVIDASNHVLARSPAAADADIEVGMRRRDAQSRHPDLLVLPDDPQRDTRLFEPIAHAVEDFAPGVEIIWPGPLAVPAQGPAEAAAAERLLDHIAAETGAEAQVGLADQLATAILAARHVHLVPPGGDADYLAPLPVATLAVDLDTGRTHSDRAALVDLLRWLGIHALGGFARCPNAMLPAASARPPSPPPRRPRRADPPARPPHPATRPWRRTPLRRARQPGRRRLRCQVLAERLVDRVTRRSLGCVRLGIHAIILTSVAEHVQNPKSRAALETCDWTFLAADSHAARHWVNAIVRQHLIPATQAGVKIPVSPDGNIGQIHAVTRFLVPGATCLWCDGLIDPTELAIDMHPDTERQHARYLADVPAPSVITLNTIVAAEAVNHFMLATTGLHTDDHDHAAVLHRPRTRDRDLVEPRHDDRCPACGVAGHSPAVADPPVARSDGSDPNEPPPRP